jgi:replicative DNA helicase
MEPSMSEAATKKAPPPPKRAPQKPPSDIFERALPADLDAEQGVIGSMMLNPDACDEAIVIVRSADFHDTANATLFKHLAAIHEEGKRIDTTLLKNRLLAAGEYETVGGAAYIGKVANAVPHAAHVRYYAEIVRDKAKLRSVIYAATDILKDAYHHAAVGDAEVAKAENLVARIAEERLHGENSRTFADSLSESMKALDARMNGTGVEGLRTGIHKLDEMTGGLKGGKLWIVAGRPGMGKSALAVNMAELIAEDEPVYFVSLEMDSMELTDRALSGKARVDGRRMQRGTLGTSEREKLSDASAILANRKLFIDDFSERRISDIAAAARRIKRKHGLGAVVIDYLQLVTPDDERMKREEQVSKMSRGLKKMAMTLKVPVVCLAQLNRATETNKDYRPRLSNLRESGAIEQDADVVLFTHRPAYYKDKYTLPGDEGEAAELILAKQRGGPTGVIDVLWFPQYTRFANPAAPQLAVEPHQEFAAYATGGTF